MILAAFSVFDKAVNAFLPPFFDRSRGAAVRSFQEACNDQKHQFHRHRMDYVLYCCGEFDDASGMLSCVEPVRVIGASELISEEVPGE